MPFLIGGAIKLLIAALLISSIWNLIKLTKRLNNYHLNLFSKFKISCFDRINKLKLYKPLNLCNGFINLPYLFFLFSIL